MAGRKLHAKRYTLDSSQNFRAVNLVTSLTFKKNIGIDFLQSLVSCTSVRGTENVNTFALQDGRQECAGVIQARVVDFHFGRGTSVSCLHGVGITELAAPSAVYAVIGGR